MASKNQVTSAITHAGGAIMTYDILGTQHLATNQIPIVLVGGMACLKLDWDRLANELSKIRPASAPPRSHVSKLFFWFILKVFGFLDILVVVKRGMGDSTYSRRGDETLTMESYARDIVNLLLHLRWKKFALCGYSMGGAIVQQILLLPHHATNPTPPYPFTITHVFLASTFASPIIQKDVIKLYISAPPPTQGTKEERKEIARLGLELCFDKAWLADWKNHERFDVLLERFIEGRPAKAILQQGRACGLLDFKAPHSHISPEIPILVIHGENDQIVRFSSSKEILSLIPHAQFVSVGPNRGQVPNLKFGHQWFEHFDAQVWVDVVESFMEAGSKVGTKL